MKVPFLERSIEVSLKGTKTDFSTNSHKDVGVSAVPLRMPA